MAWPASRRRRPILWVKPRPAAADHRPPGACPQAGRRSRPHPAIGTVFAERYHDEILRSPRQVRNALCYAIQNARRHGWRPSRWMVKRFGPIDPFSSAWYFDGWRDPGWRRRAAPPDPEEGVPVAKAKTWLLSTGWRRHRLLEVDEVPAAGRRRR